MTPTEFEILTKKQIYLNIKSKPKNMNFDWDEDKNKSNQEKHGIDFNDAKEVFKDENSKVSPDLRIDYGEKRWKIIGKIYGSIISVIYTIREKTTRIISARKTSRNERKEYNN